MLKELFEALYEKLESEEENDRKNKTGNFDYFEEYIQVKEQFEKYKHARVTSRTMKNYYEKYVEEKSNDAGTPKKALLNLISEYLLYKDYKDFKHKNEEFLVSQLIEKENPENFISERKNKERINDADSNPITINNNWKKFITVSLGLLFTLYIAIVTNENHFFNSKDCIVWKVDHYEKASCFTTNTLDNSKYKINIDLFKKVTVDTSTVFFTNGISNYWYGKNYQGKRDFFTHRGIHPETKKELKPITRNILKSEGLLNE